MSQYDMNKCAASELAKATAEMQRVYKDLLARSQRQNPAAVAKIRAAQEAWQAYRDAQLEAMFSREDKRYYGSVYSLCVGTLREQWTIERTKELKKMMETPESGEICAGDIY